jgi:hypothetical protein
MSADNYLVSIPAAGGAIALYEVSHSDSRICLDDPPHIVCPAIIAHALACHGVYATQADLDAAIARISEQQVIEYPPEALHRPSRRSVP